MDDYTHEDVQEALRPIESLISKSEKAQQKLRPGTWQHTMLRDNVKALHIALGLLAPEKVPSSTPSGDDLREALGPLESMIARTQKSGAKFEPGTSQHSLQRNRLKALRIAQAAVEAELGKTQR